MSETQDKDTLSLKTIGVVLAVVLNFVAIGVAWGRAETRAAEAERRLTIVEQRTEDLAEKVNRIDKNVAVITAWVESQQKGKW
jgi:hypothetical protein